MNLFFRLIRILLSAIWRPGLKADGVSRLVFRVWPLDLDLNMHLTNSRYLSLMDLGRLDLILRTGAWRTMRRERLGVVLGGAALRFRRSLAPFETFSLTTKMLGWDERWVYLEQSCISAKGVACVGVLRAAFVKAGKVVPPDIALKGHGILPTLPVLPDWVKQWTEVEAAFAA